jgi:DNA-directed RNA polymerase specialized sigma24 family protein
MDLASFWGRDATRQSRSQWPLPTGDGGDALRLFHKLKPQEQNLLWLAYVEGFSHGEIFSALELNEKSVRVLLFRARQRLAALLRKENLGPGDLL